MSAASQPRAGAAIDPALLLREPFAFLGPHDGVVRAYLPGARDVEVLRRGDRAPIGRLTETQTRGLFEGGVTDRAPYLLRVAWPDAMQETEDPYAFGLLLGDVDLHLFNEGRHFEMGRVFGAQPMQVDGVAGVRFAVWAPNAGHVSVIGDFNSWDSRRHPMRLRHPAGVWELFVPRVAAGARYKYDIVGAGQKADPIARHSETPPGTASVVAAPLDWHWQDEAWMAGRGARQSPAAPISIYEVHLGSWMAGLDWDRAAEKLIPYVRDMGFTHVELLPITEHPFSGSWGYQPIGMFAPTARFGTPEGFARFVDALHRAGIGILLDWVPAHFPSDAHGLARFDGTALYEHQDPREGFHRDWNTLIYNFGRREVQGFLIASALYWLEQFHVDGLRVDAVASMLYRDYSRAHGEWIPNVHGGRENLEAVSFLQHLNAVVAERCRGAIMIAEESTAWPGVTRPTTEQGLGFHYKWNMGWMHDTLRYVSRDPVHRRWHHDDVTFGLLYAFSEQFILPLSHDEVVHGKASLLGKMPGDRWQRFANLRATLGLMWMHPGKKLLFMGGELAQPGEWNHDSSLDWRLLDEPDHAGVQHLVRDLNAVYRREPAMHRLDGDGRGFRWLIGDDRSNSVFAFLRSGKHGDRPVLVVCNMTPAPRYAYSVGVPRAARWREIINTDSRFYGGSDMGNAGSITADTVAAHGEAQSLKLTLPPLAVIALRPED
ncbi:MAG: 1,4-alpha-glucan branching protein GlgB [Alphaproteobacteria bacterium]|nr:1,4-alpha-glucan branching protein GlgB [Alphaproteobacteria bacterium]MCW5744322.1 1,4-alpha-glucan branching protein GlgB [Alphaproteobacteria bacterium]